MIKEIKRVGKYKKAAMIGMKRSGASDEEIAIYQSVPIEKVILYTKFIKIQNEKRVCLDR